MPELKTRFSLIDEMSDKLVNVANCGQNMIAQWENANSSINTAVDNIASGASNVVTALSGASNAIDGVNSSAINAVSGADAFSESVNELEVSVNSTSQAAEQLAEASSQTADALSSASDIASKCGESASQLNSEMENAVTIHDELKNTLDQSKQAMDEYANSSKLSAEAQSVLETSSKAVQTAMVDLEIAQKDAQRAADYYNAVIQSGTEDARAYEMAQDRLKKALKYLSSEENEAKNAIKEYEDAMRRAGDECEKYEDAMRRAGDESEKLGKKGGKSISDLESLITSAGIVIGLKKISDGFIECSNSAAQFESAISKVSTIADTSSTSLDSISSDIMKLSQKSGQSVTDLSEATYQAISASVDTANAVEFVNEANKLATAGFTQQTTAADILTTAINAYGLAVSDAAEISDMLITTQNLGKTTVDELSQSMGKVIPLASAYNVEMDNLSTAYAELTKNGIATAESTTYIKSMLNELGSTGSDVSKILLEETGQSFASLMEDGYSLADVLTIIGDSINGDATAFNNLWSSQEAGIGALALFNAGASEFNSTLSKMQDSAGATSKAYETMTSTTEYANERMYNAFSNLGVTVGTQLNPVMSDLYNKVADVVDGLSGFIERNPAVTAGITAAATAVGIGTAAVVGFNFAVNTAIPAVKKLTAAMSVNPLFLGITVGAMTIAGIYSFISVIRGSEEAVEDYNGTLEQCASEIERTRMEYDSVCKMYDENSDAAQRLADELETLNAQYEKGGGFASDYAQRLSESQEKMNSFMGDYDSKIKSVNDSWQSGMVAVAQLEALRQKTELTNTDLDMMAKYADYLNNTFNCNIQVDYDTKSLTGFDPNGINSQIERIAQENRKQAAMDFVTEGNAQNEYIKMLRETADAKDELYVLSTKLNKMSSPDFVNTEGWDYNELSEQYLSLKASTEEGMKSLDDYEGKLRESFELMGDSEGADKWIQNLNNVAFALDDVSVSAEKAEEAMTPQEIAATVWNNYQTQIEELAKAYDEARASIRSSIDSMFGLFDEAQMKLDNALSMEDATNNLQSQIDYFKQYKDAAEQLADIGIDNDIISQLDPEQAVAFANELSEMDSASAAAKVSELNQAFGELADVKDKTTNSLADIQEEYTKKMDEINRNMQTDVDKLAQTMEFPDNAIKSAKNTLDAYTREITECGESAVNAVQDIANRISTILSSVGGTINVSVSSSGNLGVELNATGTTNSADVFIAGEEGPELIVGKAGSTVFPASETNRIISAVSDLDNGSYTSNNSYLTAENSTEYSTFNSNQNTEVINNYSSVQNSSYDDARVVSLLERMDSTFTAMEKEIGSTDTGYTVPDIVNAEPSEVIVDLSMLDNVISKFKYGDTQNIDSSRNYTTEYGDTVSNYNDTAIEYAFDNSRVNDMSVSNGDTFSRIVDNSVNYGESSSRTEISNGYTDNVIKNLSENISNAISTDTAINYGDTIRNYRSAENSFDYSRINDTSASYGDTIRNLVENSFVSSEVFNSDSPHIIRNDDNRIIAKDESGYKRSENSEYSETVSKKEFTININGDGKIPITIDKGISKEEILEIIWDCVKPAVVSIISEEMLEEGDSSYEY